jgi:RimJ/RimL family protein N-acetyltransferase
MNGIHFAPLERHHLPELYYLMVQQDFPDVPDSYKEAEPYLLETTNFGAFEGARLCAGFLFGERTEESAFIDVICAPHAHGKWATCQTLTRLYDVAFRQMGLRYVWAQPRNQRALKAALKAGFVPATSADQDYSQPFVILTPNRLKQRFLKALEE